MAAPALRGRHAECAALDGLLAAVRAGGSQVLVLHGESGVGKTALLDYVARSAAPWRVMKSAGIESEMELPFAGLHQLCAPMLDDKGRLPAPQRAALDTAFGLVAGDPPDLLLVGLAVLGILSTSADEEPLVCLVDDVQWLDRASAHVLAFVARRLLADDVAIVFAVREPALPVELGGLPELRITGLSDADARALFDAMVPGRLDAEVRDRIVAEARGNPLALLELARGLSPSDLAGGFSLPSRGPLATRIEQAFERRSRSLPEDAQALLRLASAEPAGDPALLWRAAGLLGIGPDAAPPVEAAGLLELGAQVRFPHPLMRSAVYRASTVTERRRVHQALAEATDGSLDPDRKAWHRAQAAVAPEEAVASELERAADRARARGGAAAAAAFLKQATELTPDASRRGRRALAAARAELDAGAPGAAARLLDIAARCPLDELQQADSMRLRARIAFGERRGSDAPPLLLEAARRLEPLDAALARETYLDTLGAAIFAGRSTTAPSLREVAAAARNAPAPPHPDRVIDLLVDGLATRFTDGYAAAVEPLRRLLAVIGGEGPEVDADLPWLWMACRIASEVWDDASWTAIASRQLTLARQVGALRVLPLAATYRAGVHIHSGELDAATALIEESDSLIRSVGGARLLYAKAVLLAWRGQEADLTRELAWGVQDAAERGEGRGLTWVEYATALLHNGLGHYDAALASAQAACSHDDIGITNWALVELIEASAAATSQTPASSASSGWSGALVSAAPTGRWASRRAPARCSSTARRPRASIETLWPGSPARASGCT